MTYEHEISQGWAEEYEPNKYRLTDAGRKFLEEAHAPQRYVASMANLARIYMALTGISFDQLREKFPLFYWYRLTSEERK